MCAVKAMIVDDSAVVRKHLSDLLTAGGIEVVATAADPLFAWPKLQSLAPDVLVLDVEMPRMDGISFLKKLMAEHPLPVVMCSTLTEAGCETTMQALAAGAVGFVTKPKLGLKTFLEDRSNGLVEAVKAAARANLRAAAAHRPTGPVSVLQAPTAMAETTDRVIALGLSTGGVQALETVVRRLPRTLPGIVVVQHMPEKFTAAFATRLNALCELDVTEARHGDRVLPGRVLLAPGGRHMRLKRSGAQYIVEITDGPLINHHRPSVDVLFKSVAQCAGRNAIGVILTGMGDDGARGLRDMHEAGAVTAAQDEASCVVYGMPREAVRLGGVDDVVPLGDIAGWVLQKASLPARQAATS
jgi:two-component system chemotaxis response regulator CheB